MATIPFGSFTLILDAAEADSSATIGFESNDCDRDYRAVLERGAVAIEPPSNKAWGVRAAYVQGPGGLRFENRGAADMNPDAQRPNERLHPTAAPRCAHEFCSGVSRRRG